tara:strand:+ start:1661 stop:1894 length:234 start_codon:yes stop_codon:yes gene_type:complete
MYVWTVKGTKIEDISIIFDNDSLDPISDDLRTIKDRISRRGNRKAKAKKVLWKRCWSKGRIVYYQSRKRKNVQRKTK